MEGLEQALGIGMLDPENSTDPTKRLMQALMLSSSMRGGNPSLAPITAGMTPPGTPSPAPAPSPDAAPMDSSGGGMDRLYSGEVTDSPSQPASSYLEHDPQAMASIHPAGFDQGGMPTEFPATDRMNQARDTLERAKHPPHDVRNKMIVGGLGILGTLLAARGGNTSAGAGAAQGLERAMDTQYNRQQTDISRAQNLYEFESGQEEKQREAALREKLAMSQMEATKAYRDLLVHMRERGQDVTLRGQDIGANKAGFDVQSGATPTSAPTLVPRSADELPEIQQAKLDAQKLLNEKTKVGTEKTRQQLAGGALNLQDQLQKKRMYDARMAGIEAMKQLRGEALRLQGQKMTMPTGSTRSMGEIATTVIPHLVSLRQLIEDADQMGMVGAFKGRVYDFLAGKIRTTGDPVKDKLLGRLRSDDKFMAGAMTRTHFGLRGGSTFYGGMLDGLNNGQSKEMLLANLDAFEEYARGYAQAAGIDLENYDAGGAALFNPDQAFQTIRPNNGNPPAHAGMKKGGAKGGSIDSPPAGAKIRKWSDFNAPTAVH